MVTMEKVLKFVSIRNKKPELVAKHFVVHIDDVVQVSRQLRQYDYVLKRGRVPDRTRGNFFEIRNDGNLIGILAVNVHRNMPRGEVYAIKLPETTLTMERIKVDFPDAGLRFGYRWDGSAWQGWNGTYINPTI